MSVNDGQIFTGTNMGDVPDRSGGVDGATDSSSESTYAESLMNYYDPSNLKYFKNDKGIDPPKKKKRTPKQIEDEWVAMGKSLQKIAKKNVRDYRLLEPGWAGELEDDQVAYIRTALHDDPDLAYKWGFKRRTKRFTDDLIRLIADQGDPDHRMVNVQLVKGRFN